MYSSSDEHMSCLHLPTDTNNALVTVLIHSPLWTHAKISLGYISRGGDQELHDKHIVNFIN